MFWILNLESIFGTNYFTKHTIYIMSRISSLEMSLTTNYCSCTNNAIRLKTACTILFWTLLSNCSILIIHCKSVLIIHSNSSVKSKAAHMSDCWIVLYHVSQNTFHKQMDSSNKNVANVLDPCTTVDNTIQSSPSILMYSMLLSKLLMSWY